MRANNVLLLCLTGMQFFSRYYLPDKSKPANHLMNPSCDIIAFKANTPGKIP